MHTTTTPATTLTLTANDRAIESAAVGTTIATIDVIAQIAGIAARHVDGVETTGKSALHPRATHTGRLRQADHSRGVSVDLRDNDVHIDVELIARYPAPLHTLCNTVRASVVHAIEHLAGLRVVEVNVSVIDITGS